MVGGDLSPEEVAARVIYRLYALDHHYPQDWNTDDTKTIGQWKEAIVEAVKAAQQAHQGELDALEQGWKKYHADVLAHLKEIS